MNIIWEIVFDGTKTSVERNPAKFVVFVSKTGPVRTQYPTPDHPSPDPSSSPGRLSPGPLSPNTLPDRPLPDRPGLQSCEGPGASNTTKNSTRRPPEKGKQNGNLGGRKKKKKKREILGLKQNRSTPVTPTLDQSHDGPQAGLPSAALILLL